MDTKRLVQLIIAPMMAGKTTELLRRLGVEKATGARVVVINSIKDTRYGNTSSITTHNRQINPDLGGICVILVKFLLEVDVDEWDIIGIEEPHMHDDLREAVREWSLKKRKIVIVAGLNGDRNLNLIGDTAKLIGLCRPGMIQSLAGRCKYCLDEGNDRMNSISGYTTLKTADANLPVLSVGGDDMYINTCLRHHPDCKSKRPKGLQLIFGNNVKENSAELHHRIFSKTNGYKTLLICSDRETVPYNTGMYYSYRTMRANEDLSVVNVEDFNVIGVDEGHKMLGLNNAVRKWVLDQGKEVIVNTISSDDDYNVVGEAYKLLPLITPGSGIVTLGD